ncbi:MAG TPA: fused MFS/spermidine synthase [Solirubrobacteraceae bacterium]|nr:fused MFS/spermidine synthase [Solirubrobacteraceae bacterium]
MTSPASAASRALGVRAANALVFLAAGAVLVLEILGVRLLAPYVGLTLETTTAIIGAALAGIAGGAAAGGRAADRFDGRWLLPLLLAAGGLLCIAAVPLVRTFGEAVRGTDALAALAVALAILFAPAFVLSAVSPVVAKLRLHDLEHTGRVVGSLSAWATAGALVGTFGTGFVLVPLLPTSAAVFATGGLLLGVALLLALRFRVTSPAIAVVCVAGAAALAATAMAIGSPCEAETDYHCAVIASDPARPGERTLILDDLRHSHVDLDDLGHLEFDYTRWMADAIGALPGGPLDAVYLGGGGYTLPRYVATVRPGSRARVLEVDGALVELARRRLALRTGPALRVRVGDARVTLRDEPTDSADVVVGDAFSSRSVPWHLATAQFAREIRRVLRPGGLYTLNLIDQGDLALLRAEAATLLEVFADVRLVAHSADDDLLGGNFVFLASDRPLAPAMRSTARDGRTLDRPEVQRLAGDADVLRDDDAPADQLISSG